MFAKNRTLRSLLAAAVVAGGVSPALADSYDPNTGARKPVVHVDTVKARDSDVYRLSFVAGVPAVVEVIGGNATDLDLSVTDSNGHEVARDFDLTSHCAVRWTPLWSGEFSVRVINRGGVANGYVLRTN